MKNKKGLFTLIILCTALIFYALFLLACDNPDNNSDQIISPASPDETVEENTYGLDFYIRDDGTYAVAAGNAAELSNIVIPSTYKGKAITKVVSNAFNGCSSLKSIVVPDSVNEIGIDAFKNCSSLTSITLPFIGASRTANNYYDQVFGYIFGYTIIDNSYGIPGTTRQIGNYYYYIPKSLNTVIINGSETKIPDNAFTNCSSLTSVFLENGVTSIGVYAFRNCSKITSITISQSLTNIYNYAFDYCTSLTSITIPDSVTRIGDAFYGCNNIQTVFYRGNKAQWENVIIDDNDEIILNNLYFYSATAPVVSGKYWHYDLDEITPVIW